MGQKKNGRTISSRNRKPSPRRLGEPTERKFSPNAETLIASLKLPTLNPPKKGRKTTLSTPGTPPKFKSNFFFYPLRFLKNRYHLETLPELVKAIQDPDIVRQHYGLIGVRKILSIADFPPIQPIIDAGLVPKLI